MSDWLNIPVKTRIELLREYKKQGYTYSTAKSDFEDSYKSYQNGGEVTNPKPVVYNNIQPQEVPNSTRVSTKNPQFELELLNRNILKQDLLRKSSQGDTEAELQFRDVFGTSTHRYRYDNDPNYKQQVDQKLKNWKGDKINYPSDSPFRQDAVPYNMRWMYPQLTDESQKVMGDFSNEVIGFALPIPLLEPMGKIPSAMRVTKKADRVINKADDIVKHLNKEKVISTSSSKSFKSEIDWAKWNPETPKYPELINEYNAIEESTKKAGTWMKNPDGSAFQGTPEQFIQQQSSWFKKAFANTKVINEHGVPRIIYHGTTNAPFDIFDLSKFGQTDFGYYGKGIYKSPNKSVGRSYTRFTGEPMELYTNIEKPYYTKTRELYGRDIPDEYDGVITSINKDFVRDSPSIEIVSKNPTQIKSAIGNVGFFDMTNPNIYKGLVPPIIGLGVGSQYLQEKEFGGLIPTEPLKRRRRR